MKAFRQFLESREIEQTVSDLSNHVKNIKPEVVPDVINRLGATSLDDLISKLESNPKVQQVIDLVKQASQKQEQVDLSEGVISAIGNLILWPIKKLINSIAATIAHVFGGFAQGSGSKTKIIYAATLLLTFLLAPYLLALGVSPSAVGGLPLGWSATWWLLSWFGKNVLEPVLRDS